MLDELRSRLELQGMAVGNLPESLDAHLIAAGKLLANVLLAEKKLIAVGLGDGEAIGRFFADEILNSSQLDRPPLPCILLTGNTSSEKLIRELKALAAPGDALILFQGSRQHQPEGQDEKLTQIYQQIETLALSAVLVGHSYAYYLEDNNFISLTLDNEARMNYLCTGTVISMTLAALVDHQLFGHPL